MAWWLGVGLRTLGSWVLSPHLAWLAFEASFTPICLEQYTQLQMSTNIVGTSGKR